MTLDEIRQLILLATETGVAELEVQRGDDRVRIRRGGVATPQDFVLPAAPVNTSPPASAASPAGSTIPAVEVKAEKPPDPGLILVKSPIVGTFYECPSPGSPPFVRVGERVQPGKV